MKGKGYVIVEVNNIGYKVFVSPVVYAELEIGTEKELYTHHHVKEDAVDLFGFRTIAELEFFELLLSISGIGPKSALGVLSVATVDEIKESIAHGDPALLTKVSGIGKKTAERVVLELRDKIAKLGFSAGASGQGLVGGDEIDALMALGYSLTQARDALKNIDKTKDSGERIREALRSLGK